MKRHLFYFIIVIIIAAQLLPGCKSGPTQATTTKSIQSLQGPSATSTGIITQTLSIPSTNTPTQFLLAKTAIINPPMPTVTIPVERDLKIGMEGEDVQTLENVLFQLDYLEVGRQDGIFDIQTEAAVRHFQLMDILPITGVVDNVTRTALTSANPIHYYLFPPFPANIPTVSPSVPVCDDHALQDRLATLGYIEPGSEEWSIGAFGPETQSALMEFQKKYMTKQNGKADLETWTTLFSPIPQWTKVRAEAVVETWHTSIYPADPDGLAMAWDGSRLWLAVSKGDSFYDNFLIRIDPDAHPAEAAMVIRPRDCETQNSQIANMIFAGGKIWLLYNNDQNGNPTPLLQAIDPESGIAHTPFQFASCPDGYCFPASGMGFANGVIWVAASDRAYGINPFNGSVISSRPVGFLASGKMVYDGQCFWYLGEATVSSFNPQGGSCRASDSVNALSFGFPETNGKLVWTANSDGTLSQLNLATGISINTEPVVSIPSTMVYAINILWVADSSNNTVVGISPDDGGLGMPIQLDGENPTLMVQATNDLWVYFQGSGTVQRVDIGQYDIAPVQRKPTAIITATASPTPPILTRSLYLTSPNMQGDDVLILQEKLLSLGYIEVGIPDGLFGPKTDRAVRHFQEDHGLVVDGIVGPITWGELFE